MPTIRNVFECADRLVEVERKAVRRDLYQSEEESIRRDLPAIRAEWYNLKLHFGCGETPLEALRSAHSTLVSGHVTNNVIAAVEAAISELEKK